MKSVGHVAHMGKTRKHSILIVSLGNLGKPVNRKEDNIKIVLEDIGLIDRL
jgi:hypothetical protein